jgi:hypothetical protein
VERWAHQVALSFFTSVNVMLYRFDDFVVFGRVSAHFHVLQLSRHPDLLKECRDIEAEYVNSEQLRALLLGQLNHRTEV